MQLGAGAGGLMAAGKRDLRFDEHGGVPHQGLRAASGEHVGSVGKDSMLSKGCSLEGQRPSGGHGPAADPWRISSTPDFGPEDPLQAAGLGGPSSLRLSHMHGALQDRPSNPADSGSPWTPPAHGHSLDPFTAAQAAGFSLPFDGFSERANSVVDAVLGPSRDEFAPKDVTASPSTPLGAGWAPGTGLLSTASYQLPGAMNPQLRSMGGKAADATDGMGMHSPSQRGAREEPGRFMPTGATLDRLAVHGLGTSPWSMGGAAERSLPASAGGAGPGLGYLQDPLAPMPSREPRGAAARAVGMGASPGADHALAELAGLDLGDNGLLGALASLNGMQSMSYQDQMLLLQEMAVQEAQQQQQQQQQAKAVQQMLLQEQHQQQHHHQAHLMGLGNNIKSTRSLPHGGMPPPFGQVGSSRLGDPGRMQGAGLGLGDEPMSPMQQRLRMLQSVHPEPLAVRNSHGGMVDDGSAGGAWPQASQVNDMARLLAMQQAFSDAQSAGGMHPSMLHAGDALSQSGGLSRGGARQGLAMRTMGGAFDTSDGLLQQTASLPAATPPRQRLEPRLPHKLVATASQAGITATMLWVLIKHPTLLDMIVKEREVIRGGTTHSAGGAAPATSAAASKAAGMMALSAGGALNSGSRKLGGLATSSTGAMEQAIAHLDPVKRQEELAKTQAAVSELLVKTARFLQGPQMAELASALAPIAALYDSMHDLSVVQKRRKCAEIGDARAVLLQQAGVKDTVALLAKLRAHVHALTTRLLLLADTSSEGVPLDIMLGCCCTELTALLKPHVPQDVLDALDTILPSSRLALLVFVEFTTVDPLPPKENPPHK